MPDPIPLREPYDAAAHRVINALAGFDIAQKVGILETCKHIVLAQAVAAAGGVEPE
jgi:hypothetical protein